MQTTKDQRKEAIRQFKERKPAIGVFGVRCTATGRQWVGTTRNLDAARNATWFSLRLGSHRDAALQQAYQAHGEAAFAYEVLEVLDEETAPLLAADLLKARKQYWMEQHAAAGLL